MMMWDQVIAYSEPPDAVTGLYGPNAHPVSVMVADALNSRVRAYDFETLILRTVWGRSIGGYTGCVFIFSSKHN